MYHTLQRVSAARLAAFVMTMGLTLGCASATPLDAAQMGARAAQAAASSGAVAQTRLPDTPRDETDTAREAYDYFGGLRFSGDIPTPESVLGYEIGTRFTRHADVVEYCRRVAAASDRVMMAPYGSTHEGRTLHYLTISSPDNLERIEEILQRNRALTDPETSDAQARRIIADNPAVVWLSYNVHGNEASSSEAAMRVLYTAAAAQNAEMRDILDKVVLVIDPMINPDGRDRYVNWYNSVGGVSANRHADAAEHSEPWPGGRTNHYYFDLNRDWLWLVHPESRSRIAAYRQYMPQLHIDYHEQGYRSPYFFGAGDDPYNQNIPAETREWVEKYGEANAEVFDRHGLPFATKERFDYLYPGYGKVMPVYHGAVGMLVEQAGHGFAGLAIDIDDHNTLTLRDRTRHHFLTSMSYLETTAANRQGQLERFRRFFEESMTPEADGPKAFILSADNDPALLQRVWDLCSAHGIEIETLTREASVRGLRSYLTGEEVDARPPAGSWVIPAGQRMGRLARAIFERATEVTHIETYDITGWSVPLSFGLEGWYTNEEFNARTAPLRDWRRPEAVLTGDGDTALVIDSAQHDFPTAIGHAVRRDLVARRAGGPIAIDGRSFEMGSLIVYSLRNRHADIDAFIDDCLASGINVHRTDTSMTSEGHVLGANDNGHYTLPKIMLLRDSPVSSYSFGQIWHYLDIQYPIPYTAVNAADASGADWSRYNTLVIPSAFGGALDRALGDRVKEWVRSGGTIVAIGGSASWATNTFVEFSDEEKKAQREAREDERPDPKELTWQEREDRRAEDNVPGAMFKTSVDTTHPLAAGARGWAGVLKSGAGTLDVGENGSVVARFDEDPFVGGYASERNIERIAGTPFITHHRYGRGNVICVSEDVSIRGFMHGPMRLVLNAIIFGASM